MYLMAVTHTHTKKGYTKTYSSVRYDIDSNSRHLTPTVEPTKPNINFGNRFMHVKFG